MDKVWEEEERSKSLKKGRSRSGFLLPAVL